MRNVYNIIIYYAHAIVAPIVRRLLYSNNYEKYNFSNK